MAKKLFYLVPGLALIAFLAVPGAWTQNAGELSAAGLNGEDAIPRDFAPGDYHGVISANMASGDLAHELLVDFGNKGIWWLGGIGGPWYKVTSDNPTSMLALNIDSDPAIEVAADFGVKGLWLFQWTTGPSWTRLTGDNPTQMIAVDDDNDSIDELQVDFDSKGLWRYDGSNGWKKLTVDDPSFGFRCDMWTPGYEEGLWNFSTKGVYFVFQTLVGHTFWTKLTDDYLYPDCVSAELGVGSSAEELVLDFGPLGTWGYDGDTSPFWSKLTNDILADIRPVKFEESPDYELLAAFTSPAGLWMWNASGAGFPGVWTKLTNDTPSSDEAFCQPFDPDGLVETSADEEVAVDFGLKGLYLYNFACGTTWTKLTNDSPQFMVRSDLAGDGRDTTLICDFGAKGLWYYYGPTGVWTRLTADSPD